MRAERNLVIAIVAAGHDEGQMIEDAFVETLPVSEPVRRSEIDPRLPFFIGAIRKHAR